MGNILPETDNLAWAPATDIDGVEILDRHNGVPTFGVFRVGADRHLFWRVVGYVGDVSVWLYVPLAKHEFADDGDDWSSLSGVVYDLSAPRYATIGIADHRNRIVFEREWQIPVGLGPDTVLVPVLRYIREALEMYIESDDLPATRREAVEKAHKAVVHLVPA